MIMLSSKWAQRHEIEKFEMLFRQEYKKMYRYAQKMFAKLTKDKYPSNWPEEAVQDTFEVAWEKREKMFSSPNPAGWLFITLNNIILRTVREDRRRSKLIAEIMDSYHEKASGYSSLSLEMSSCVSPEDWRLLERLYLMGDSYKQLCGELGVNKSTLGMHVRRVKEKIRRKLK